MDPDPVTHQDRAIPQGDLAIRLGPAVRHQEEELLHAHPTMAAGTIVR